MRPRFLFLLLALAAAALLAFAAYRSARSDAAPRLRASLSVTDLLGGEADSLFARAREPRPFVFPEDHGPHPAFRTEWWYLTGNLAGPDGTPYGFQLTMFRTAAVPPDPSGAGAVHDSEGGAGPGAHPDPRADASSAWATDQLYMGHFAVTDGGEGRFRAFERFARGAVGLAGARARPFRVWVEGWSLEGPPSVEGEIFPLTLKAGEGDADLELVLDPLKPPVLQGEEGLSRKGPEAGNASYYYSFTRLAASGALALEGDTIPVTGTVWLDREWSTSALGGGVVGWDWFALQLDSGDDLMVYRLRREDGSADPFSAGSWVSGAGEALPLEAEAVELEVLERWPSPVDGAPYPVRWHLRVPSRDLDVEITPLMPSQELALTFRYWEGAVRVSGTLEGRPVTGVGYVELTGYADAGPSEEGRGWMSRTGGR